MRTITLVVSGEHKTGKSRLVYLLEKLLKKEGFEVELGKDPDYPTDDMFHRVMYYRNEEIITDIKKNTKIVLEQLTTNKQPQ